LKKEKLGSNMDSELIRQIQEEAFVNPTQSEEWDKTKYVFKVLEVLRCCIQNKIIKLQLSEIYESEEDRDVVAHGVFMSLKEDKEYTNGLEIVFRHREDAENFFKSIARCIDIHAVTGGFSVEQLDEEGD
jgi:hypothetical protein